MTKRAIGFVLQIALALPAAATSILYSTNGTTTPTYTSGFSWDSSSVLAGAIVNVEMQFTAGLSGTVGSIVVPISANVSDVTFLLRSDLGGVAGSVIDTFTFDAVTSSIQLLTAQSTLNPTLTSGTMYWLEMEAPTPSATAETASWYYSSPAVTGLVEVDNPAPAVSSQTISAFAVLTAEPEPSTLGLALVAMGLLAAIHRRRVR